MQSESSFLTEKLNQRTTTHPEKANTRSFHNWPELFKQWESSGLPQKEFCRIHALSYANFVHHRVQLKKAQKTAVSPWLPVKQVPHPLDLSPTSMGFTVKWPNGVCLCVPLQADAPTLQILLTHLGG